MYAMIYYIRRENAYYLKVFNNEEDAVKSFDKYSAYGYIYDNEPNEILALARYAKVECHCVGIAEDIMVYDKEEFLYNVEYIDYEKDLHILDKVKIVNPNKVVVY